MKLGAPFLTGCLGGLAILRSAQAFPQESELSFESRAALSVLAAAKRALPDSPTDSYLPATVQCPAERPTIREASGLSANETAWLEKRRNNTLPVMQDFLSRMNISGFDVDSYFETHADNASALPNIGIACSGGGWRALMNGAGAIAAFDNRTANSTASGHLGGLLQSATYLAGLSGGSWLVGSIYMNNFSTVPALRDSGTVWQFQNSVLEGPPSDSFFEIVSTAEYYADIYDAVNNKSDAGYNISITDFWGRALSFQLINATDGGAAYTWSSISEDSNFESGLIPMPIVVADARAPGQTDIPSNTTVYEFNPFEFGSFDPTTYGFAPTRYIGSNFSAGSLPNNDSCVRGFDNAGFVMGTSSSLFNEFLLQINSTSIPSAFKGLLTDVLDELGEGDNDIANYQPNPFYHWNNNTSENAQTETLTLVDGGEDLQNLPLHPLIQPVRNVDVIFAVDSSADTDYYWPNATALVATYQRSLNTSGIANGTSFPAILDQNTIVNLGLNQHPTFFGCNASNTTGSSPLIVYIPNSPYSYQSNVSTYQASYEIEQRNDIIQNGYNVATMGNGTVDSDWGVCVACATLSRSWYRTGTTVPTACETCFTRYCWNGTLNSTTPVNYNPEYHLTDVNATSDATSGNSLKHHRLAILGALATGLAFL